MTGESTVFSLVESTPATALRRVRCVRAGVDVRCDSMTETETRLRAAER